MSMREVQVQEVIVPWVGPTSYRNVLSVIVLSTNIEIIKSISQALTEVHDKGNFRWKLIIHRALDLAKVVEQSDLTGTVAIDFAILGLDTNNVFCLEWTKKVVAQIHPDLRIRRLLLVNASGLPVNSMAVDAGELISLYKGLSVDMLNANVFNSIDATFLARRLLKYLEVSTGVNTGIPNLNV